MISKWYFIANKQITQHKKKEYTEYENIYFEIKIIKKKKEKYKCLWMKT